jgi:tetratricopeptide (TPR) repeat protein
MEEEQSELKSGDVFAGYRVVEKLGPGVMGTVYLARDTASVKRVALKILQPELVRDEDYIRWFEEQASAAIETEHRHVAKLYAAGTVDDVLYTASEFVPGNTLAARIERQGRLDPDVTLSLILTIAKALRHLHSHGIIHGGVNPGNIRTTPMGEVKLVDVGLAKKLLLRPKQVKAKVQVTPVYLAPELVKGPTNIDHRADIYSLGITAFEALTGTMPFMGATPHETVLRIMNEPLTAEDMKGVPADMADLIVRMTAKHPDDRPPDMLEVISEMEKLAAKYTPVVVGAGPTEEARAAMTRRTVREWRPVLVYAIIAAIVIVTIVIFVLPGDKPGEGGGPQAPAVEEQAAAALKEAKTYETEHPDDIEIVLEKYRSILRFFPGTSAVDEAKEAERRIAYRVAAGNAARLGQENRLYDAVLAYETYANQYPDAPEKKEAEREKAHLLDMIRDNYNKDMLEAGKLIQEGRTDQARAVLARILSYCTPELGDKARRDFDRELGSAGSQALRRTYSAAWQAAEPMLAAVAAGIVGYDFDQALALCEEFLSSSLPEGVEQILFWEREDVSNLQRVIENFEAALGDAAGREDPTNFTLADGRTVSGPVTKEADGYYLKLGEGKAWRINPADLAPENVLKLAGMGVDKPEALLTSMLYEVYYGSLAGGRTLLAGLESRIQDDMFSRYQKKLEMVSVMPLGPGRLPPQPADPLDIRRAAEIVDRARVLIERKDWDRAYTLLKEALSINAGELVVWSLLAKCADRKELTGEAIHYCRKALTMNPGNPILWNQLGSLYLKQEKSGLALSSFGRSGRINPADPAAAQGRIEALLRLGRDEEARRVREEWEKARQK